MAHQTVRQRLRGELETALESLYAGGFLSGERPRVELSPPKQKDHGDFACAVALALAKPAKKNPREIATRLHEALGDAGGMIDKAEIAGPGFLNLFVTARVWREELSAVLAMGVDYMRSEAGAGQKILIEFVSANPTGPLHIAHGRGAVTGDILAALMTLSGYHVEKEYYVNDLGFQIEVMSRSIHLRYRELHGHDFRPPDDFYPGEYLIDVAQTIKDDDGDRWVDAPEAEWLEPFSQRGIAIVLERIKSDLSDFGIEFDHWVSEKELTARLGLEGLIKRLEEAGHIYEKEGKKWFRTTDFGDDKDRVVVREDGRTTYFASDILYHDEKLSRGFGELINIWGADHGGYITRVKAGLAGLGHDPEALTVMLVQIVSLSRGGKPVRMGKRLGTAIWLRDVLDEVGRDATRYFFAMRRADAQMDFDVELATKKTLDNPVYYAQMGHARMCSIERKAAEQGVAAPSDGEGALDALELPEELQIIKNLARVPEVIAHAAEEREPHQIVHYIQELIQSFHSYYTQYKTTERVISDDPAKTRARLLLCGGLKTILRGLLATLGVDAPEQMYLDSEE